MGFGPVRPRTEEAGRGPGLGSASWWGCAAGIEHRRLWVFGPPRLGGVLVGLPGQDFYAEAWLSPTGRPADLDAEDPGVEVEAG
ncbi:hypothetical protein ACFXPA_32520 [Amycolatopsis sp. NPDC059090]|uniref:hypothetical protein n=1 Tax=Amycolatopsis sp. NPDC059090 TaxID=3346723 RepID=UPI00366F151C